jgi:hypothetical protein
MTKIRIANDSAKVLQEKRSTIVNRAKEEVSQSPARNRTILSRSADARDHEKDRNQKTPRVVLDPKDASIGEATPGVDIHLEAANSVKTF